MQKHQSYNDQTLLDLLSKNDEFAFTELYHRYWQKLFTIAYNRLKDSQAAEDIVHDVFASLWANRQKSQVQMLDNYLATAVKYMVLAKIKTRIKERTYKMAAQQSQAVEMSPEASLHYKRLLEIVKKEVEKLPEKCRLIFNYSRKDGMPTKEIAEDLQISPKTVENQLHKAIKQLKIATRNFLNLLV